MSWTAFLIILSILSIVSLSILLPKRGIIYIHSRLNLKKSIYIPLKDTSDSLEFNELLLLDASTVATNNER
jgi:hypothetical protein